MGRYVFGWNEAWGHRGLGQKEDRMLSLEVPRQIRRSYNVFDWNGAWGCCVLRVEREMKRNQQL